MSAPRSGSSSTSIPPLVNRSTPPSSVRHRLRTGRMRRWPSRCQPAPGRAASGHRPGRRLDAGAGGPTEPRSTILGSSSSWTLSASSPSMMRMSNRPASRPIRNMDAVTVVRGGLVCWAMRCSGKVMIDSCSGNLDAQLPDAQEHAQGHRQAGDEQRRGRVAGRLGEQPMDRLPTLLVIHGRVDHQPRVGVEIMRSHRVAEGTSAPGPDVLPGHDDADEAHASMPVRRQLCDGTAAGVLVSAHDRGHALHAPVDDDHGKAALGELLDEGVRQRPRPDHESIDTTLRHEPSVQQLIGGGLSRPRRTGPPPPAAAIGHARWRRPGRHG